MAREDSKWDEEKKMLRRYIILLLLRDWGNPGSTRNLQPLKSSLLVLRSVEDTPGWSKVRRRTKRR